MSDVGDSGLIVADKNAIFRPGDWKALSFLLMFECVGIAENASHINRAYKNDESVFRKRQCVSRTGESIV